MWVIIISSSEGIQTRGCSLSWAGYMLFVRPVVLPTQDTVTQMSFWFSILIYFFFIYIYENFFMNFFFNPQISSDSPRPEKLIP